jgi:Arc/MetJ family transcription regulator
VTKRLVDIDDDLLDRAREILGADTIKDTVNGALDEVIRLELRRQHAEQLATMRGLDLADDEIMSRAWRH